MFRRSTNQPTESSPGDMALDTLAGILRNLAEFALEQDGTDITTFRATAEAWAQHVTLATAPPGSHEDDARSRGGRREWEGVRRFIREYLRASAKRVTEVTTDLRQVLWVFIRNISQAFSQDEEVDGRLRGQMERLEQLVRDSTTVDLKREVLDAVAMLRGILEDRVQRHHRQVQVLGAQVRSLGHELESARRESETDPLTRIPNRKAFDEYLARSVEIHRAFGDPMSMMVVDVDHFKGVNDGSGHVTGDEVLRQVADAVVKVFLRKNDFVARIGGDEFAVILRETRLDDARALAERVVGRVRSLLITTSNGERQAVTVSVGLAQIAADEDEKAWFDRTDRCLYAAKEGGRDRVASIPSTTPIGTCSNG
jgi:diguanylate cyclase (GGDEF)-like protein